MSLHRSLKTKPTALNQHRNVLTRPERIAKLTETERFHAEKNSPLGLVKVANRMAVTAKKEKKEAIEGAVAGAPAAAGAAPVAAGGAGAAGKAGAAAPAGKGAAAPAKGAAPAAKGAGKK